MKTVYYIYIYRDKVYILTLKQESQKGKGWLLIPEKKGSSSLGDQKDPLKQKNMSVLITYLSNINNNIIIQIHTRSP